MKEREWGGERENTPPARSPHLSPLLVSGQYVWFLIVFRHLTNIFVEAYNVLYTYLMGDSRKNELYIAKYIDFFLTQFEYKSVSIIYIHFVMSSLNECV